MSGSRPAVSVVVPFAGDDAAARSVLARLRALRVQDGDELIVADNCGVDFGHDLGPVRIVRAAGERSPAHARNAGAAAAAGEWILFLDADVRAPADLLDAYFAAPVGGGPALGPAVGAGPAVEGGLGSAVDAAVGALVGEIVGAPGACTLAGRYGASRNFLSQRAHLAHPFRPRAAAANLMVRRAAFEAAGGFAEGVRAAEDTDFCWRLQDLGYTLELRPEAAVEHEYRETIRDLRRQWRGYAAGRAWLAERYPGFVPQPAAKRAALRAAKRALRALRALRRRPSDVTFRLYSGHFVTVNIPEHEGPGAAGRLERLEFLALDVLLALDELIGLRMSNEVRR